ncbi:NAD(P)/FAD-dependent oxidoreductase [Gelidibacter salicanalis]|uniref:NADH:ubiquinone reductase (non-electrogenic) n=1 Tax=Gelidibacter salicanalis TaxID=291193 RepID=A0A5C7AHC4_9FLAO|nr:NAD(P)/FAD-dependent oxidoreductase [Gelidibacter salicanalis]TXE07727.1 NAD(P)/FAD-dependent oxidoreductase [Gelidibacter salicanalis]
MADKQIIVLGGGFAGINLAKKLSGAEGLQVTLVDRNNYNFFPPLLYQVATGMLDISSITIPFRTLFTKKKNLHFRLGEVEAIDATVQTVKLSTGTINYDYLVVATGTESNFFGVDNIEKNALAMKNVNDAIKLRNYLIMEGEKYTFCTDEDEKRKMRNIVISGAGPSGVEIAGMIAEMRKRKLMDIYPELDGQQLNIYLVDGAPSVLPPMSEKSQRYTQKTLENLGIIVKLNKLVSDYTDDKVYFKDGETIETKTLIWTAGVTGIKIKGIADDAYEKGNRLQVDAFNRVLNYDTIFAIGDACIQKTDPEFPEGHPQLGSVAQQQGKALADNFVALVKNEKLQPFRYQDKGAMAIIGDQKAVADMTFPKTTLTGWIAWFSWLFVHLFLLVSYRNKFRTFWNWFNAYVGKGHSQGVMVGQTVTDPTALE